VADSRGLDLLIGGWNMTSITLLQSGAFLTPTFSPVGGGDPSGTNPGQRSAGGYQRPDCLSGVDPIAALRQETTSTPARLLFLRII